MVVPTVCTILTPGERPSVEAAGHGYFAARHEDSITSAILLLRRQSVEAVLVSARRCDSRAIRAVGHLVREFPGVPTVALVSQHDAGTTEALLGLGASGVHAAVDLSTPSGWRRLRNLVADPASPAVARVLARILPALGDVPADTRLFFEVLVRLAPVVTTVRDLCRHLEVSSSTLMSRFFRAGVPSPKSYLSRMRLVHAAYLFETPGLSITDVAYRLDYSSPQSLGRHLKSVLGITASEYRSRFSFEAAIGQFVTVLIVPHREGLRRFSPLNCGSSGRGFTGDGGDPLPLFHAARTPDV